MVALISRALLAAFGRPYMLLAFYKVFWIILTYLGSYFFVKRLINFVEEKQRNSRSPSETSFSGVVGFDDSPLEGYLYAIGLFLTAVGSSVCLQQLTAECTRIGVQVRAGLMAIIYRKALKLSNTQGSIGNIINLISNDCNRIAESFVNFHFLWSSALEILVVVALAFVEIKVAAVPALIILILLFPVQYFLSLIAARLTAQTTSLTAARIHIMSELLTAIKLIKFYAWESYFRDRVTRVRAKEMAKLRRGMLIKITSFALVFAAPVITTLSCITVYELMDNRGKQGTVEASVVFTILSLFNTLRYPLVMLPIAVKTTLGALLSFERLDGYLALPEVEAPRLSDNGSNLGHLYERDQQHDARVKTVVTDGLVMNGSRSGSGDEKEIERRAREQMIAGLRIYLHDADFSWLESPISNPTLKFINLSVKPNQLVAVVGDVGSGKSSLLAAIMGQIKLVAGDKEVHGSMAYVPHDAWLLNATLKENILFGAPYNRQKYNDILRVCALNRDLNLLSNGDETEIGERGVNLSHGQRQRVSLARAVYSDADIMLLDDPLSGMDAQIGRHIFQECIKGYLAKKTVIYVTNQLQHLAHCDHVVMMKCGSVEAQGSFQELMESDVNLARIVDESMEIEDPDQIDELTSEIRLEPEPTASASSPTSATPLGQPLSMVRTNTVNGNASSGKTIQRGGSIQVGGSIPENEELNSVSVRGTSPVALRNLDKSTSNTRPHLFTRRSTSYIGSGPVGPSSPGGTVGHHNNTIHAHSSSSPFSNITANEQTIHRLRELNAHTIQNQMLNEQTISRMIERNQMTILGSMGQNRLSTVPTNREENSMARAVERNQLTIHSLSGREAGMSGIGGNSERVDLGYGVKSREGVSGWAVTKAYLRKDSGIGVAFAIMMAFLATHALRIFSDYWLHFTVGPEEKPDFTYYLGVYGGLVAAIVVGVYLRGLFLSYVLLRKAVTYHDRIFRKIMHAPMSYFDVTPLGRILNVFARHLYVADDGLPDSLLQLLQYAPLAIGTTILVIGIMPWSAIAVVILGLVVYVLVHLSSRADERLKGLEAITKPPIFAHMAATLDGLISIRVYGAEERFDSFNLRKIDDNHKALFAMMQLRSWLALYLDLVSSCFVLVTAMCVVYFAKNGSIDASGVGLAVTNALQLLIFGQWSIRMGAEVKSTKESICQLELYGMNIPAEAPDVLPDMQPPPDWPSKGEIEFKNVVLRYHSYGVAVLKRVSFVVAPCEKIGVVGKMGSGKTTLLISLLRVVEAAEGKILIDGLDIREMGLRDLRSKIAIIPQEPVLFVGTIRSNLDPFHRRTDQEIWAALDAVHLSENIKQNMPMKLETPIVENGRNFSLGQRQLFCIARAILFQSRILVLDEATSAVDLQTDLLIQDTIKKNFANCTVLMIAHRLNTIIECDKILVMDDGRVVEFDRPAKLIQQENGYFHALVKQSGPDAVSRLQTMLREHGIQLDDPASTPASSSPGATTSAMMSSQPMSAVEALVAAVAGTSTPSVPGSPTSPSSPSSLPSSPKGKAVASEENESYVRSTTISTSSGTSSSPLPTARLLEQEATFGSADSGSGSNSPRVLTSASLQGSMSVGTTAATPSSTPMPRSLEDVFAPPNK
ncbi:Multidrug resistance-associated protein 4 [Actinomortierella wolfii]|nr:Multidrug resistance-associated protein 4 [Actinomortierella wolfii]